MARGARLNAIDRAISWLWPQAGVRRLAARAAIEGYEGAQVSRVRRRAGRAGSPDTLVESSAGHLREQARHLERNHDLSRGALNVLVNSIVGPAGIGIEPQPRRADGTIHAEFAREIAALWEDWQRAPDVTKRFRWSKLQRMMARTWLRDGEAFSQDVVGPVPTLNHGTRVPYSIECFEPDMVPLDHTDRERVRQGIEHNAWGAPVAYWVYKDRPDDRQGLTRFGTDLKRVPAQRIKHLFLADRLHQRRGASLFASVITRLEDLKDYEESERVAAKVAAMLTAYVKRGTPDLYTGTAERDSDGNPIPREINLQAGAIIDSLAVGEDIGLIDSKRPNPNALTWRQGQLKAAAAGWMASYSSVSKDYGGTFSSQRQELVEQWITYATLTDEFCGMWVRPVWETFIRAAIEHGVLKVPADVLPESVDDALMVAQQMPWIDPVKEAQGYAMLVRAGFMSEPEVIRRRGAKPGDTMEQIDRWRQDAQARGLVFSSDAAHDVAPDAAPPPDPNQ